MDGVRCSGRAVTFPWMCAFPITVLTQNVAKWFNGGILFCWLSLFSLKRNQNEIRNVGEEWPSTEFYKNLLSKLVNTNI